MVSLAEDAVQGVEVLGQEGVSEFLAAGELLRPAAKVQLAEAAPVQQAVAGDDVDLEGGGVPEPFDTTRPQRRHQQAEAGDRRCERVDVHTADSVQSALDQHPFGRARLAAEPFAQQPREGAEQEVAGAAGGIDEAEAGEAELVKRRGQGAVQDELLDELRGLQQGEALLRLVGEVLVQVAEEAGVPFGVGEVVAERAGVRVHRAPERQQVARRVAGDAVAPHRIALAVVELRHSGQAPGLGEDIQQVVAVRVDRVGAEVERLPIRGACIAFSRPGDQRRFDQAVVLRKTHEHAAKQPRDRGLGQRAAAPDAEGVAGAPGLLRSPVFLFERGGHRRVGPRAFGEVLFQPLQLPAQVPQQ